MHLRSHLPFILAIHKLTHRIIFIQIISIVTHLSAGYPRLALPLPSKSYASKPIICPPSFLNLAFLARPNTKAIFGPHH
ncbi:hypothetical protein VTL71DRAFT_9877 [Oculimacula yallundae]|uniref:Uncharacterized protein n=1 Tax=Oculimacula yallundae TaxID=86028 RepID=A0ABR4BQS6_9HELO